MFKKINKKINYQKNYIDKEKEILYSNDLLGSLHISPIYRRFLNSKIFGYADILDQKIINNKINDWGNMFESFFEYLINKYNVKYMIKSLGIIYSNTERIAYEVRENKANITNICDDVITDLDYNGNAAELMSREIKILMERTILRNNKLGVKSLFSNKDYKKFLTYQFNWSIMSFYSSRNNISKTGIKIEIQIYPFRKDTINTGTFIEGTCKNNNLSRQNYNPKLFPNISEEFNQAFKLEKQLSFSTFDTMLNTFLNYFNNRKNRILLIPLEKFEKIIRKNYKKINLEKFISNNCLSNMNINVEYRNIYKSKHKYRLDTVPFILIDNEILIIKGVIHNSLYYWRNVYNQGIIPYNDKDLITSAAKIANNIISEKMVKDTELIFKKQNNRTYTNVKYNKIFGNQPIDYGDFDIISINDEKKILFNIEVKYIGTSMTGSELETDLYAFYSEKGHAFKCNRRNQFMLHNKSTFLKHFDALEYKIVNLMLISKPMEVKIRDDKYNFETVYYFGLEEYIKLVLD